MRTSLSTVVVAAIVLVGCSGSVSPAPSSLAASQGPSIVPTASSPPAKPSPTATPTAQPTVEPTVAALAWGEPTTTDGDVPELEGGFDAGPGAFVSVYQAAIAFSPDGIHWQNVDSPIADVEADYLSAVAIGPTGIVAVGEEGIVGAGNERVGSDALVMFSADGLTWQRISDPAFKDGQMQFVGATNEGFVAFGSDFSRRPVIWTSPDGREWLRATNETGLAVARGVRLLIPEDGRLTALVGPPRTIDEPDTIELEVWQTEGRAEWQRVGRLPDRVGPALQGAAGGGRLLVMDRESTWTSTDGSAWERGAEPDDRRDCGNHGHRRLSGRVHCRRRERLATGRHVQWERAVGRPHVDVGRRPRLVRAGAPRAGGDVPARGPRRDDRRPRAGDHQRLHPGRLVG